MTREAFIKKWLDSKRPYNEENKDAMRDDLDSVIKSGWHQNKCQILKSCFEDVVWMAIRYAHGRNTYAPSMVRDAVKKYQRLFPDWKPREDLTIEPPNELTGMELRDDYLDDLFNTN
jgi:hypothetical protein